MRIPLPLKSARQVADEAAARADVDRRLAAGRCMFDVFDGFNSRRSCELAAGHKGFCA